MESPEIGKASPQKTEVAKYNHVTEKYFIENIYPLRKPAVLQGFEIGSCIQKWSPQYLANQVGSFDVKIHVATNPQMDFLTKNFAYRTLPFKDLIERAFEDTHKEYFFDNKELYYLRSLGTNARKDIANIKMQFPNLAQDINIPELFPEEKFFSSVFRIGSAGVQLWTHYDIMDNVLIQISGRKRVVLFSPKDTQNIYLNGDKSEVLDIDNPDLKKFPLFAKVRHHETVLEPGDILFIPALWFHNTLALNPNVAINVFWQHLDSSFYDKKDIYGNKDLVPAVQALQLIEKASQLLNQLPDDYKDFYARRSISKLAKQTVDEPLG